MARRKRASNVLVAAHQRMAGLNSITPAPDFGPYLTLAAYATQIEEFNRMLDDYNQMIAAVDEVQNRVDDAEAVLLELNKRMLAAAQAYYGPDSNEYEQAGGTRRRDYKRPAKKALEKTAQSDSQS